MTTVSLASSVHARRVRHSAIDVECNQSGEVRVIVNFSAPDTEDFFETTLVVESNDPTKQYRNPDSRARIHRLRLAKFGCVTL